MATGAAQETFHFIFTLTDAEIELFRELTERKRRRIAPFNNYWALLLAMGLALSFAGGAMAHNYFGVPLDTKSSALVTALFGAFLAGVYIDRWTAIAWWRRASASRIASLKEPTRLRAGQDGIGVSKTRIEWSAPWQAVEDVTAAGGLLVLWMAGDQGFAIPVRAIQPAEELSAFVELVKKNAELAKEGGSASSQARDTNR